MFAFFVGAEYFFGGGIPLLILGGFISAIVGVVIADHLKDAPDEEGVEGNSHQQAAASQDDTQ
ncbi:hypothetical protein [Lentibacter sp. XHP0401]|uniref:hypothetical protein n=1 Tax=Lentibacter sp. XHP0401 TaxID=2984334 RepID=UPI0021E98B1F|nr:hypothetical protein [Lentibacter sp. XHP0401]